MPGQWKLNVGLYSACVKGKVIVALALQQTTTAEDFGRTVMRLRDLNTDDLSQVDREILSRLASPVSMIPDLAGHLINAGGKRLRPMLTLSAARSLGYEGEHHIVLAAAVELIHGATLLHDDVVDDSALRRGEKTANIIWGNKESVLVGDYIFSRAFELMVAAQDLDVLRILSRASSIIAEGEVLQLATQNNLETTEAMYFDVIDAKTAALFAAATHVGAVIASGNPDEASALRNFGRHFGIAYQLIDDALDYAGFERALGKTIGDDFREGKMTLPVINAVAKATPAERNFWNRTIKNGVQQADDFEEACGLVDRHGALDETFTRAGEYAERAIDCLKPIDDNVHTQLLRDLVESSLSRNS